MNSLSDRIKEIITTGMWLGYSPIASGTVGTLPAIIIYILIRWYVNPEFQRVVTLFFLIAACVGCVLLGEWAEKQYGKKDPGAFVLDEMAGFWLTVLFFSTPNAFLTIFWAFIATRFFDILKPFPANESQNAHGGWGILLDDLLASVYAIIFLKVASWASPWAFGC
ncbi:MAG: phosphatidylglycerophosphatase A [Pseudomonadota bacterium]